MARRCRAEAGFNMVSRRWRDVSTRRSDQLVLPIFDVFVFVDWYGTLSTARFWDSITTNDRHPLAFSLRGALEELFVQKKHLVRAWMRGERSVSRK
jgi:hypothetical protein